MILAGCQKCTLIDFPGKVACIVFTQGCNLRCPFCHNSKLWPHGEGGTFAEEDFFFFLAGRREKLDGVVVSGGEPTLQPDLEDFLRRIRDLGFATKLDTNGLCPAVLTKLLNENLLNFVAMDLKHALSRYALACGVPVPTEPIRQSLNILRQSSIDYELRTTAVPGIHSLEDLAALRDLVAGVPRFTLQNFSPESAADPYLRKTAPFSVEQLESLRPIFEAVVEKFTIR
ncbi:MAG: anaerobic ribonucleoside-triphosphate reductase activating protein [Puniceicoccales bacterium]|jgi:pyruvate formate lyase activating enzyme|nr:anaerobic ribonucleoside-triphosphate reductase activating protein [Puniceicoccales bacterium]